MGSSPAHSGKPAAHKERRRQADAVHSRAAVEADSWDNLVAQMVADSLVDTPDTLVADTADSLAARRKQEADNQLADTAAVSNREAIDLESSSVCLPK